jgi:diacylglycerol O-acyltransferase / wax synthase
MDRMNPLDSGFWHLEDEHASLHIASVSVFVGPAPTTAEIASLYRHKLPLMPRYRQKMRTVPFGLGRPVWVDDPTFDLTYHLRRTALPAPGGDEQLGRLVGRLMSQRLDRERPLWETWIVEGLEDDRWALVSKVHHSVIDGVAGVDALSMMLDTSPGAALQPVGDWSPEPEPGVVRLLASALLDRAAVTAQMVRGLGSAAARPRHTGQLVTTGVLGLIGYARSARPIASTSLTGPIGTARRYRWLSVDIADVVRVRQEFGGSVNDVVLGIVTRGFRDLLLSRGEEPDSHAVRSLVPVSVRKADQRGYSDNRVSALLVELPVEFADPVSAYNAVAARMRQLKSSHEAAAGELFVELAEYVPPVVFAAALHAAFRVPQRTLTTVTTNVPGPRQPLYALGRRMLANYPYVPIANQVRIGVAVTSYDGRLFFGLTCDRDSVPDIDVLAAGIHDGLIELLKMADASERDA